MSHPDDTPPQNGMFVNGDWLKGDPVQHLGLTLLTGTDTYVVMCRVQAACGHEGHEATVMYAAGMEKAEVLAFLIDATAALTADSLK